MPARTGQQYLDWNYATLASKGVIARRYPYNYVRP
jgi:hypothetical protein